MDPDIIIFLLVSAVIAIDIAIESKMGTLQERMRRSWAYVPDEDRDKRSNFGRS